MRVSGYLSGVVRSIWPASTTVTDGVTAALGAMVCGAWLGGLVGRARVRAAAASAQVDYCNARAQPEM